MRLAGRSESDSIASQGSGQLLTFTSLPESLEWHNDGQEQETMMYRMLNLGLSTTTRVDRKMECR